MARSSSLPLWSSKLLLSRQILGLSFCLIQFRCCFSTIKDSRILNTDSNLSLHPNTKTNSLPSLIPPDHVTCVLSDMDGTLLSSKHRVEDRTLEAVSRIMRLGYKFFPCTGRSRRSMYLVAGPKFTNLFGDKIEHVPGVYQQGLTVYGANNTIIYERFLDVGIITDTVQFCRQNEIGVIAYAGDEVYCQKRCYYTNRIAEYAEPLPDVYEPGLDRLSEIGVTVNKLILLDDEEKLVRLRPILTSFLNNRASFTSAVPGMLEVLPPGASKGYGVLKLLEHMNISPEDTVAFGDGENDIEMLELVGYGVAVDNAKDLLKRVAKYGTKTNDEYGVASILELLSAKNKI